MPWDLHLELIAETLITGMRAKVAKLVMGNPEVDSAILIDDDMDWPLDEGFNKKGGKVAGFNPIVRLMSHPYDMVGALCFDRSKRLTCYAGLQNEEGVSMWIGDRNYIDRTEPFRVDFIGFGMVRIKREVFVKTAEMIGGDHESLFRFKPVWEYSHKAQFEEVLGRWKAGELETLDVMHEVHKLQAQSKYLGEDLAFCQLARRAGFAIYCDPLFDVVHYGSYGYGRLDWLARHDHEQAQKAKEAGDVAPGAERDTERAVG
jgi:hypothetical protein